MIIKQLFKEFGIIWSNFFLLSIPITLLSPLAAKTKADLNEFAVTGLFGTAYGFYLMILNDSSYLTFPSFHIIWTVRIYEGRVRTVDYDLHEGRLFFQSHRMALL